MILYKVNDVVIFSWLGMEMTGKVIKIRSTGYYTVLGNDGTKYPCYVDDGKFGIIMSKKTKELKDGIYTKSEKTDIDYKYDELIEKIKMFSTLHDQRNVSSRVSRQLKKLISDIKREFTNYKQLL